MSRIGKKPIPLPKGVSYTVEGNSVTVKGPKGTVHSHLPGGVSLVTEDGVLLIKRANESMMHALRYSYINRRDRKGDFRELWIMRINAAAREHDLSYSRFMNGLKKASITLDRKALASLASTNPEAFAELAKIAKEIVLIFIICLFQRCDNTGKK